MEHKDNILKITKEQIKKELQTNDETTLTLFKNIKWAYKKH